MQENSIKSSYFYILSSTSLKIILISKSTTQNITNITPQIILILLYIISYHANSINKSPNFTKQSTNYYADLIRAEIQLKQHYLERRKGSIYQNNIKTNNQKIIISFSLQFFFKWSFCQQLQQFINLILYKQAQMDQTKIPTKYLKQLFKLVQLDYMLDGIPSKDLWNRIDFSSYQLLAIIGRLQQIKVKEVKGEQYFCPIFRALGPQPQKIYKLMIPIQTYKEDYVKIMNKIFKGRDNFYILIANIVPLFFEEELIFAVTQNTLLFGIPNIHYQNTFSHIIGCFQGRFSHIKFQQVFNACQVDFYKENGIPLQDLKKRFSSCASSSNYYTLSGVVEIKYKRIQASGRKTCRVVGFNLYQSELRPDIRQFGTYSVRGLYYFQQQQSFLKRIRNWSTIVIKNAQRFIQDSGKLQFQFYDEEDIIVIDDREWKYAYQLKQIWRSINFSTFDDIKTSSLVRNFLKFRVELTKMNFLKLSYQCKKCHQNLRQQLCDQCNQKGTFEMWSECEVQDGSYAGIISIQNQHLIRFLGLSQSQVESLRKFSITSNGNILINRQTKTQNQIIKKLRYIMKYKRVQKDIIGIPTFDSKKFLKNQDESKQQSFFIGSKYRNLNINGVIQKIKGSQRWMVKLKVYDVL